MTDAERQRRCRAKRNFDLKAAKKQIAKLNRLIIEDSRLQWMERDLALAVDAATLAYGWHPEDRDVKRLKTRLAELRRMAARFRREPMTYHRETLWLSDRTAVRCTLERLTEWERYCRRTGTKELMPANWIPPDWVEIAEEQDEWVAQGLTPEEIERRANGYIPP